jgi:3-oxoacyl-[acyl-carrier protein] reductase
LTHWLQGKLALITGGTSGIGLAIAKKFAEEGAEIVLFGKNPERGEAAKKEILEAYPSSHVRFFSVDVAKTASVETAIQAILEKGAKLDILVNCAGITKDQLLMKMSEEEWDEVMGTNAKSCFNTSRSIVRSMLKARRGKIINISSVVGIKGNPGQVNYAASKGAIIAMTKAMALELASRNIQVNCIAPGFIHTKMTDALTEAQKESILSAIPLGRMGLPEEVANAALFLASPLSDYITGHVLTVDGGMAM